MKELSIEEKAKRYDEAIERAKEMIKDMTNIGGVAKVDDIQYLFPELKESEDERIRKELFKHLKEGADGYEPAGNSEDYKRWLGWLEKQGEQKPADIRTTGYWNVQDVEQKPAWCEEDEELMKWSIINLTELKDRFGEEYGKVGDCIDWLNSLRPQNKWKPSDEQIEALQTVYDWYKNNLPQLTGMQSLFNDLLKLKG